MLASPTGTALSDASYRAQSLIMTNTTSPDVFGFFVQGLELSWFSRNSPNGPLFRKTQVVTSRCYAMVFVTTTGVWTSGVLYISFLFLSVWKALETGIYFPSTWRIYVTDMTGLGKPVYDTHHSYTSRVHHMIFSLPFYLPCQVDPAGIEKRVHIPLICHLNGASFRVP